MGTPKPSKRDLMSRVVHTVRLDSAVRGIGRRIGAKTLTVVNYHRVNYEAAAHRFDEGTLDATPESFDEQVAFLKREYSLLTAEGLREHLNGRPWPRKAALITFDDGYLDNYQHALPILKKHGARALFFIASDYVSDRRVFWWDRISNIVKRSKREQFSISYPRRLELDTSHGTEATERDLHQIVYQVPHLDLERYLTELASAASVSWSEDEERRDANELLMSWEQVRELRSAGMGIGSHTRTHRELSTVPTAELSAELTGSRKDIERQIGEPIWSIAYPVGFRVAHVPRIRSALEDAGYEIGFTYNSGVQRLDIADQFDVARVSVEREWPLSRFSTELLLQ